jgi:hypothetical protein
MKKTCFLIICQPGTLSHGVCVGFLYLKIPHCISTENHLDGEILRGALAGNMAPDLYTMQDCTLKDT